MPVMFAPAAFGLVCDGEDYPGVWPIAKVYSLFDCFDGIINISIVKEASVAPFYAVLPFLKGKMT